MTNTIQTAGEQAQAVIDAILRDGFFVCTEHWHNRTCMRLHTKGTLDRDKKDGKRFTLSAKGRKAHAPKPEAASEIIEIIEPPDLPPLPEDGRYPHHALAELFPMQSGAEIDELGEDIRQTGQQMPIWLYHGAIIDGRNREEACHRAGIAPRLAVYRGDDPLGFVLSLNLKRRHLSESQRAMVAAKIVDWEKGLNQSTAGSANLPTREAAKRLSISERAVTAARRIREHGAASLIEAIDTGRVSVHAGEAISQLERQAQDEVLRTERRQIIAQAKQIRTETMATRRAVRTEIINRVAAQGEAIAGKMPRAAFPIGYCDFPWKQEARSEETGQDRGLMYPSMSIEDGMALCAGDRSPFTADALLYAWTTTNRQRDMMRIGEAWGFEFMTSLTWDKVHIGMGFWVRDQTEHLYIFKRGNFPGIPLDVPKPASLYREPKTEHSRKPVHFAEEIERLFPDMRKLELFQRRQSLAPGDIRLNGNWDFWGNEAGAPEHEVAA